MALSERLSVFLTEHTRAVLLSGLALLAGSGLMIVFGVHFASDVLDMLPAHFDSVRIFKIYDDEFSQARELTFGIYDESGVADLDEFVDHFANALHAEKWIIRVMDRSPMELPTGMQEVQTIAVPLLLNLPSAQFDEAVKALDPTLLEERLRKLHAEIEAGSPTAEFQLDFDPLGLIAPALKPLAGSFSSQQTRPLSSPDGTLRVVQAVTTQSDLGPHACQATMLQVEQLKRKVLADWPGSKPEILVTGRTPYVAELSKKMHGDVMSTLLTSVLLVSGVFWLGFQRIRPLLAIIHVLLFCCVLAVALGALVFHELNMITIGLCSILIGLGVDFGMMLYAIYEAERDAGRSHQEAIHGALAAQGRAVAFGALTSAAAFGCLVRSECPGFAQLGVLISFGIVLAGFFMMTVFFALIGREHIPRMHDPVRALGQWFVNKVFGQPKLFFCATAAILVGLCVFAVAPIGELRFEANPRSLEPQNSQAGRALRLITGKMPAIGEPWIILVHARDQEDLHDRWSRLQSAWDKQVARGILKSAATPAGLTISPATVGSNVAKLTPAQIAEARGALSQAIEREGLRTSSFASAFALLDALQNAMDGVSRSADLRQALPLRSVWRFVLDRFFGVDPLVTVGYVVPARPTTSAAEKNALLNVLNVPGVEVHYSGWSYTLTDLIPWAKGKLAELSAIMIFFNILLLLFLYRSAFPLFVLMLSLLLCVGAMIASLKLVHAPLNLFNVLAFPLVLGVGVDYGIYVVIAMRARGDLKRSTALIVKPVLLSGLTAVAGFGSLILAENPALRGLGIVCALGVAWCLFGTFFFILPLYAWRGAH